MNTQPDWLDAQEYPFASHFFELDDYRMHYVDEGEGPVLLFVHGTPSWSFDYRRLIRHFRSQYRCVAVDSLGFGLSDKPAQYPYSVAQHTRNLTRFVSALQLRIHGLIVHDFGGPIGLGMALEDPDRVGRIACLNTWMWSAEDDPDFRRLRKILKSPLLPPLYRCFNFSPRFILPRSFRLRPAARILRHYSAPFPSPAQREGPLAFVRSLVGEQALFQTLWERRALLAQKPWALVWGMDDTSIPPRYLARFESVFPHARTLRLTPCGHFPQEEYPDETARFLADFFEG